MIRDKRKNEAYFSTLIQSIERKNEENRKQYLEKDNPRKVAYFMVASSLCAEFSLKYSFGENKKNLECLYNRILDYYSNSMEEDGDVYSMTLHVISWGILFNTDKAKLQQFYELIKLYRLDDVIFSSLLHSVLQTKEIYPKLRFKRNKPLQMLEKIFASNKKEAEQLVKEYLEKFFYTKENLGDALNTHKIDEYNYVGYWAWEAAAIVKVLDLDDSSFKDNEYYPYDLLH